MNTLRNSWVFATLLLALALSPRLLASITWPGEEAWEPLTKDGSNYWDTTADEATDTVDLVGSTPTYPAAYWAHTDGGTLWDTSDDQLLFRVRVDESPGAGDNFVWTALVDTDGDSSDVEWSLQLDSADDDQVELVSAVTGGSTVADVALAAAPTWTGADADFSRIAAAGDGSSFDADADAFVDFGIPWDAFAAATGVSRQTPLSFAVVTSNADQQVNRDVPLGLGFASPVSSVFGTAVVPVPEPSTAALLLASFSILAGSKRLRRRS